MKLNRVEKKEKSMVELEIAVTKDEFENAIEKAYRKTGKRITVPGFRKGKAPRKLIEQLYGKGVFYEDAINESYPAAYEEAIKEADLEVVGRAEVDIKEIDEAGNGYVFTALVPVKPEIEIGKYKGLSAEKEKVSIDKKQVDDELTRLQKRVATYSETTGPLKNGDTAVIDFEGFIDGVPFDGGKGEQHPLTIGSGAFIPGFEEQLIGKNVGDDVDVKVTFPEKYHAEELQGKEAVFKCKIRAAKEVHLPELDDEFAKDASEFDTLADLRKDIETKLKNEAEKRADAQFEELILDQLVDTIKGDIPEAMYDTQVSELIQQFSYQVQLQGTDLNTYLKMNNMDEQSLKMIFRAQAERQVKVRLILDKIAAEEKIEVTDDEVAAEFKKLAEAYKLEEDKVRAFTPEEDLKADLRRTKALDYLRDNSKAKAPSAKKTAKTAEKTDTKKTAPKKETAKSETKTAAKKEAATKKAAAPKETKKATKTTTSEKKTTTKKTTTKSAEKSTTKSSKKSSAKE